MFDSVQNIDFLYENIQTLNDPLNRHPLMCRGEIIYNTDTDLSLFHLIQPNFHVQTCMFSFSSEPPGIISENTTGDPSVLSKIDDIFQTERHRLVRLVKKINK